MQTSISVVRSRLESKNGKCYGMCIQSYRVSLNETYLFLVAAFNGDILLSCCRLVSSPCGFRRFDLSEKKRVLVGDEMMERQPPLQRIWRASDLLQSGA
ncbi:hypothetical protein JRO89_XS06G0153100 [Xanthoceras sorbifolium]|uniref:Uncharacterized protein n=1 Tax=Xanthoceras sorbifolium TaxID=99658 RepID=A0ABQ8HYC7_9ROSI|nr:hypothetical protein JRO89_XS06G0153100 [Xanthoceras sorbifolium]